MEWLEWDKEWLEWDEEGRIRMGWERQYGSEWEWLY